MSLDECKTKFAEMQSPPQIVGINKILTSSISCKYDIRFGTCDDDTFGIFYTSGTRGIPKGRCLSITIHYKPSQL